MTKIQNTSISFNLQTWLLVDGYLMLALCAYLLLAAIGSAISEGCGACLLVVYMVFSVLYGLFRMAWLIIGAVMFWGYLQPNNMCSGPLNSYMWALLIINFVGVGLQCCSSRSNKEN